MRKQKRNKSKKKKVINMKIQQCEFVDAQQMALDNPDTFEVPSFSDLNKLDKGDLVKVCAQKIERFWVEILSKVGNTMYVKVANDLIFTAEHGCYFGKKLVIETKNIYSIYVE